MFMDHRTEILDLRTALEVLRQTPGQLVETRVEVDPAAELSGVYRHVGAGGTVMRPTTVDGPAMLFHNVKGHPGCSVAIGVLASRARVASLFGCKKEELGHLVQACAAHPIQPVVITGPAPAQEVVHLASDPDFDLNRLIPAPHQHAPGRRPLHHPGDVLCHPSRHRPVGCNHPPDVHPVQGRTVHLSPARQPPHRRHGRAGHPARR